MKTKLSRIASMILALVLVLAFGVGVPAGAAEDGGDQGLFANIYTPEVFDSEITYREAKGDLTKLMKVFGAALSDTVAQADSYFATGDAGAFLQRIGNRMLVKDVQAWRFGNEETSMGFCMVIPLEAGNGDLVIMVPFEGMDGYCVQLNVFYGYKDELPDVDSKLDPDDTLEMLQECAKKYPGVEFFKNGASPETIKKVQEALNAAGFECGTADGKIGKNTRSAIKAYRKEFGLEEGDFIGDDLLESMGLIGKQAAPEEPVSKGSSQELPEIPEGEEAITVRVFGQPVTVTKDTTETFREKMLVLGGEQFYEDTDQNVGNYALGFFFEDGAVFGTASGKGAPLTDVTVFANPGSNGILSYRGMITDKTTKEDLDAISVDFWNGDGRWMAEIPSDDGDAVIWVWFSDDDEFCFDLFFEPSEVPAAEAPVIAGSAASDTEAGWVCESCGTAGLTGKFCTECGVPKPVPKDWTCPTCGKTGLESNFCTECGTKRPE